MGCSQESCLLRHTDSSMTSPGWQLRDDCHPKPDWCCGVASGTFKHPSCLDQALLQLVVAESQQSDKVEEFIREI